MRVAVLGAGISGLSLGWFLKQRFGDAVSLSIYEKNNRPGGWISSNWSTGFLFEEGPRSCRSRGAGAATLALIEALGMSAEVIAAAPAAKKRYVYHQGKLCAVPGILGLLGSPLMRGMIPALWRDWRCPPSTADDESIYDFVARRFSAELAERLVDPLVSGIYAGDIRRLSVRACFPQLPAWEREHGSVLRGLLRSRKTMSPPLSPFVQHMQRSCQIFSLERGMESLVTALAARLEGSLLLNSAVDAIAVANGRIQLSVAGETANFDRVFCALPAGEVCRLFKGVLSMPYQVAAASVAVVGMGWHDAVLDKPGFGYLVPTQERQDVLGVVFDSAVFPQQNRTGSETRLTAMLGGAHHPQVAALSQEKLAALAREAVARHLHIGKEPDAWYIHIAKAAIPQYMVGHAATVAGIQRDIAKLSPHITLLGNSWHGVAVNDCIEEAAKLAATLERELHC